MRHVRTPKFQLSGPTVHSYTVSWVFTGREHKQRYQRNTPRIVTFKGKGKWFSFEMFFVQNF